MVLGGCMCLKIRSCRWYSWTWQ